MQQSFEIQKMLDQMRAIELSLRRIGRVQIANFLKANNSLIREVFHLPVDEEITDIGDIISEISINHFP
jgi:hypothetical protein